MNFVKQRIFGVLTAAALGAAGAIGGAYYAAASGDPYALAYTAPQTIPAGTLGVIELSEDADSYAYATFPGVEYRTFEDGTVIVFATPIPGEYVFVVAAAKGGQVALVEIVVLVEGGAPPAPDGFQQRLATAVRAVKSSDKEAELEGLASGFETVASMAAAGVLKNLDDFNNAVINRRDAALGDNREAWSGVSKVIGDELSRRNLSTVREHADACREIAAILRSVQ